MLKDSLILEAVFPQRTDVCPGRLGTGVWLCTLLPLWATPLLSAA